MRKYLLSASIIFFIFAFFTLFFSPIAISYIRSGFYDSDLLFPFSLYNAILSGSGNFDWVFSGIIPYFPELFTGFLIYLITKNIHLTILIYAVVQLIVITCSYIYMGWSIYGKNKVIFSLMLIFSALPIITLAYFNNSYYFYMFAWYKHFGIISLGFLIIGKAVTCCVNGKTSLKDNWKDLIILGGLSLIGTASDALFIIQFIIPIAFTIAALFIVSAVNGKKAFFINSTLFFFMSIGLAFYQLPGVLGGYRIPLGNTYINPLLTRIPSTINSIIKNFSYITQNNFWIQCAWFSFYIACLITLCLILWNYRRKKFGQTQKRVFFILLFFLIQLALTVSATIFSGSTEIWYYHPIIFTPLFWGWPFLSGIYPRWIKFIRHRTTVYSPGFVLAISILLVSTRITTASTLPNLLDYYPAYIHCIDENASRLGLHHGIANYWQARPITLLSKAGITVSQVYPNLFPLRWENSSEEFDKEFDFVVADRLAPSGFLIDPQIVISRFGEPASVFSCENSDVLVYNRESDTLFKHQFAEFQGVGRFEGKGWKITIPGYALPSQVGEISGNTRAVYNGEEGYLTYGPYLHVPRGRYSFQIEYEANNADNNLIGTWGVVVTQNNAEQSIISGQIKSDEKTISADFENLIKGTLEIRIYYKGEGSLVLKSMKITRIE